MTNTLAVTCTDRDCPERLEVARRHWPNVTAAGWTCLTHRRNQQEGNK